MSLHKFADMVAKQGRGEDSLLIHMTPDEVQRLQQFAEANGRSLTINPETGLPEAGMLSDLFKAVAPIALGAFLGPGAFGIAGLGLSAGTAGLVTGGLTTLATGSLSRGLMAGLGAYGGAGLAQGLADAGTGAGLSEALAGSATGTGPQVFGDVAAAQGSSGQAFNEFLKSSANPATMSGTELAASGLKAAATDPLTFAKNNFGSLAAAAAPIMAGQMVPTTTKMPENTNPAYIRQKLYDPYTQTYKTLAPVKASEWGNRSFSDAYTNPQTGIAAALDQRQPTPMAGGGIVALAGGGVPGYALGGAPKIFTDEELYQQTGDWNKAAALRDAQNVAVSQYNATNNPAVGANINQWIVDNPFATAADINNAIKTAGLTQDIVNPYLTANTNISDATRYALSHASEMPGAGGLAGMQSNIIKAFATPNLTQAQIDAEQAKYGLSNADVQSPLTHGYQVAETDLSKAANYLNTNADVQAWLNSAEGKDYVKQHPEFDASDIAYTHFKRYGEAEGRKWEDAAKKPIVCGPGFRLNAAGTACEPIPVVNPPPDPFVNVTPTGFYGNDTGNILTRTPGDITSNTDGTVTVTPNIPGRPDGGFPGMAAVRDAYTAGGGSLGYTSRAPKTIDEFNQLYNRQTGDSLAAYDYLMGKGGGKYPVQSKAASTAEGIMRPYWSAGMKYKPKFLSYGKDGEIKSSSTSGTPADAKAADLTAARTIEVVDSSGETTQTYTAVLQPDGTYLAGNGKRYDVTGKQLAADGGMMGYAMGGGLGSLGSYSDGGRLLKGPGDGVSDSIPATIGAKQQPARLADGEFVIPARIVSELGNGSTDAGAKKLYAMMDRVQKARGKTTGKNKVAANSRADKHLPA